MPSPATSPFSASLRAVTIAIVLTTALVAFEGLSVAAALASIGAELGEVERLPWVITGYLLLSGLAVAISGPLVDGFGARRVYRIATLLFCVTSALCGLAPSLVALVVARLFQGAAGGMLMATSAAAIGLAYPQSLRSRVYALAATIWGVVAFGGPALAGVLLAFADWRWLFLVNVPLALFAAVIGWSRVPGLPEDAAARQRFDLRGIVLITGLSAATLVAVSEITLRSSFAAGVALVLAALYWWHSGQRSEPVIDRAHFAAQPFRGLAVTSGLVMAAGVGIESYLPLYLQGARGQKPALAAWAVLFLTLGWTLSANVASRLYHRVSEPRSARLGAFLMLPAIGFSFAAVYFVWPLPVLFFCFFAQGVGIGTTTNANITVVQERAHEREIGRATAAHQFLRNMAVTYGTALAGTALLAVASARLGEGATIQRAFTSADTGLSLEAGRAVGVGFAAAHLVSLALAAFATVAAGSTLKALERRPTTAGDSDPR